MDCGCLELCKIDIRPQGVAAGLPANVILLNMQRITSDTKIDQDNPTQTVRGGLTVKTGSKRKVTIGELIAGTTACYASSKYVKAYLAPSGTVTAYPAAFTAPTASPWIDLGAIFGGDDPKFEVQSRTNQRGIPHFRRYSFEQLFYLENLSKYAVLLPYTQACTVVDLAFERSDGTFKYVRSVKIELDADIRIGEDECSAIAVRVLKADPNIDNIVRYPFDEMNLPTSNFRKLYDWMRDCQALDITFDYCPDPTSGLTPSLTYSGVGFTVKPTEQFSFGSPVGWMLEGIVVGINESAYMTTQNIL